MSTKNTLISVGVLVLVAVAIVLAVIFTGGSAGSSSPALVAFAQCLASKNITMYGLYSCPHCQAEKTNFGDAFRYVPYVECTQEAAKCTAAGVDLVPTWIFPDGRKFVGEQGLDKLSQESGCPLTASSTQQ